MLLQYINEDGSADDFFSGDLSYQGYEEFIPVLYRIHPSFIDKEDFKQNVTYVN